MKEKIAKLIDVKSLVTLSLTIGYIILTFMDKMTQEYQSLYLIIIGFYFGTQAQKIASKKEDNEQ